jgi:prepilin-type N-terminal cleavage/methylation domain-containing protein
MPTKRKRFCSGSTQVGFSLIEVSIVVAIFLVVVAITIPNASVLLNSVKLRGTAQDVAGIYQQARMRAVQDDSYYEVLPTPDATRAFVDTDGNGVPGNLLLQLPSGMVFSNAGAPAGLDQTKLGFTPLRTESSTMFDLDGTNRPGLAWSSRGLPCQRTSATSICQTGFGWVQYLQMQQGGQSAYAAVTVSPAGRVKTWTYSGGVWR